jgi:hypothetical protein
MAKFMAVHRDPDRLWSDVEENWVKLAKIKTARWIRTYYNKEEGLRYCVWFADSGEELANVFLELKISFESIVEVEETVPDVWGKKYPVPTAYP